MSRKRAPTLAPVQFDLQALADRVRAAEDDMKRSFISAMWSIADMLREGLAASQLDVTRYKSEVACAMGRSESYVDKYLRLSRVPPERRAEVTADTFRGAWAFLFPPRAKSKAGQEDANIETEPGSGAERHDVDHEPKPTPSESEPDEPATEEEDHVEPEPEGEEEPEPEDGNDDEPEPEQGPEHEESEPEDGARYDEPEPEPDGGHSGAEDRDDDGGAFANVIAAALGAASAAEAVTRVTELRDRERAARADAEQLRAQVARLEKERDLFLNGGPIGQILRELGVKTTKAALTAIRAMKEAAHAA